DETLLLSRAEGIQRPRLALDSSGTPWLVCEATHGGGGELLVFALRNTGWSDATTLATPVGICRRASLATGPDAGLWAAYDCYRDGYQVYVQRIDLQCPAIP